MKFIKLTNAQDGVPIYANPAHISSVIPANKPNSWKAEAYVCALEFDDSWSVRETAEEIVRLIDEALAVPTPVFGGIVSYPPSTYTPPVWIPGPADNPPWGTASATTPPTPGLELPVSFLQPKQQS